MILASKTRFSLVWSTFQVIVTRSPGSAGLAGSLSLRAAICVAGGNCAVREAP
jgi:hypothetical protein